MIPRTAIHFSILYTIAASLAACGQSRDEPSEAGSAPDPLPPMVREMIRNRMAANVNPLYMSLWTLTNKGDMKNIPTVARQIRGTAQDIRQALNMASGLPQEMLGMYERMAAISDSIALSAEAEDFRKVVSLTRELKVGTCDRCHATYQYAQ